MYYANGPEGNQHSNGNFAVSLGDIVVTYIYTTGGLSLATEYVGLSERFGRYLDTS